MTRPTRVQAAEVWASPGFRQLLVTRWLSLLGDGIFQLAAAKILIFDHPGDNPALQAAALYAAAFIPFSIVGPFAGVFIDRWDRRKILIVTPAFRAVLAALLPIIVGSRTQGLDFFLIVVVVLSANRFFLATMGAILPQYVPEEDLLVANTVASVTGSVSNVVGLGIGAGLAEVLGGSKAVVVSAAAFGLTTLAARTMSVHRGMEVVPGPLGRALRQVAEEMARGIRRVATSTRASYALTSVTGVQFFVGVITGAIAEYFVKVLGLGVGSVTGLLGVLAIGIGIGVVVVPWIGRRLAPDFIIPLSFAVAGVAVVATGSSLTRTHAAIGAAFIGVAYAMIKIPVDTIVQEEIEDSFRGRAFAVYDMLFHLARVGGVFVAGMAFAAGMEPTTLVILTGVAYLASGGGAWAFAARRGSRAGTVVAARRGRGARVPREVHVGKKKPVSPAAGPSMVAGPHPVLSVGELVGVRSYSGSRADETPRAIVVGGQDIPIDGIEWRAVEESGGERHRIFVVRIGGDRIRLAYSEASDLWEVQRFLPASH